MEILYALAYLAIGAVLVGAFHVIERFSWGSWRWEREDVTYAQMLLNAFLVCIWPALVALFILCIPFMVLIIIIEGITAFCSMPFWKSAAIKRRNRFAPR